MPGNPPLPRKPPPCFRDLRFSDLQILAKTGTPILGSLGGNRAAGEKILRFGTPKIVIPKGESPPQAEKIGDLGSPKCRFYKGNRPKRGPIFYYYIPGNPPPMFRRISTRRGGFPGMK